MCLGSMRTRTRGAWLLLQGRKEGASLRGGRSLWEGAEANVTGGAGAGPEQELEAQKWGLNPDGQQREAVGNGEKSACG